MASIQGELVNLRKLTREDVDKMQQWGRHEDPLYFNYNFPKLNSNEADQWYKMKTAKLKKKCFAIENKDKNLVGYLSIRDIKWIKRESELGIVLDPIHINNGYGTEAICLFLGYYFNVLKMLSITLRTAKFNKRAIRCYLNCGFAIHKEVSEEFEDQYSEIFYNPLYTNIKQHFKVVGGKNMTDYFHMKLTKEEFHQNTNNLSTNAAVDCE